MSKVDPYVYSTKVQDEEKFSLGADVLFDRIINLRFRVKARDKEDNKPYIDEFIIRSDYEAVFRKPDVQYIVDGGSSNEYIIQRCNIKPSIKLTYTSYGVKIGIDIYIDNFFLLSKANNCLMSFTPAEYDISTLDIQMGYRGQFDKLVLGKKNVSDLTMKDLFTSFDSTGYGIESITIDDVEYVNTEKLAPNYVLHIHGYVGSTIHRSSAITSSESATYSNFLKCEYAKASGNTLQSLFFNYVTRRFVDKKKVNKAKTMPKFTDGFMSESDGTNFGTDVYLSPSLAEKKQQPLKDSSGKEVEVSPKLALGGASVTLDSAMQKIFENTGLQLAYTRLTNGSILVYQYTDVSDENIQSLSEGFSNFIDQNEFAVRWNHEVPAVYNINISAGKAILVCPYFAWINPFQRVKFEARYAITSLSAFYSNSTPTIFNFYLYRITVAFATVEDVNEMTLIGVPEKKE